MTPDEKRDTEPAQKYHHGPCNAYCRCTRLAQKPDRRFCACGQELMGARLEFAYLSPVCGDCAASKGPGAPSLDTRIAAARAVTDEAEGAWSTATSEGP